VKVVAIDWIDYLQMAKLKGEWLIINVLWDQSGFLPEVRDEEKVTH